MKLTETSPYLEAELFNIIKIRANFDKQISLMSEIYYTIDRICKIVTDYFGGTIDDVYTEYNQDDENPEITSTRHLKLNDKMFLCIDIYHPSIEDPFGKIELIPSYHEDENHEPGDCSSNVVTIEVYGKDDVRVNDCLGTSDEFFKYIDDQELLNKLDDLGYHLKQKEEYKK